MRQKFSGVTTISLDLASLLVGACCSDGSCGGGNGACGGNSCGGGGGCGMAGFGQQYQVAKTVPFPKGIDDAMAKGQKDSGKSKRGLLT